MQSIDRPRAAVENSTAEALSRTEPAESDPDARIKPPTVDDIVRWLGALIDPDQDVELRAPKARVKGSKETTNFSRFFVAGPKQLAEIAREAIGLSGLAPGVYFTLNPVRLPLKAGHIGAKDDDIIRRIRMLVDCDPKRPADLSATDAEKSAALAVAMAIRDELAAKRWPAPVIADSGNGWHLIYAVDLPNDNASLDLVKAALGALAARFGSSAVGIDIKVSNASRIVKLYGTKACKGPDTADRPHRFSRVVDVPKVFTAVGRELVEELASEKPGKTLPLADNRPRENDDYRSRSGTTSSPLEPLTRAGLYLAQCDPAISGENGHNRTLKVACNAGPGFDLAKDDFFRLLSEVYNPRCEPRWSDKDLRHKVDEAYRLTKRRGWLLDAPRDPGRKRGSSSGGDGASAADPPQNGQHDAGLANGRGRPNEASNDPHRLARLFIKQSAFGDDGLTLRYWNGEWHKWDGSAYRVCSEREMRAEITRVIKSEFDRINLKQLAKNADPEKPPEAIQVSMKLVGNVLQALSGYALLRSRKCPRQPAWIGGGQPFPADDVLPARNALVHLPSLADGRPAIHPPTPRFFCPYALDYDFSADAPKPVNWLTFLGELPIRPDGDVQLQLWPDDVESRETLQEWMGLNLIPDTRYQKIGVIIGPKRCGKGTIARVMTGLVGPENVANPTLSSLGRDFGVAPLIGKLSAIMTDARLSGRADIAQVVERLLSISGEDGQTIDRKHKDAWTGRLLARFTLISNDIPRLAETSGALAGRMVLLRLTRSFYGKEDERLMEKLIPEMPGILLWAIEGWKRLRKRGHFNQPGSGRPLVEEMEDLSSPVGMFIKECCSIGPGRQCKVRDLFTSWRKWCEEKNRKEAGDEASFGRNLRSVIPELETKPVKELGKYHREFVGIELADTDDKVIQAIQADDSGAF